VERGATKERVWAQKGAGKGGVICGKFTQVIHQHYTGDPQKKKKEKGKEKPYCHASAQPLKATQK